LALVWLEKGDGAQARKYAELAASNGFAVAGGFWKELEL
jgi:hypothetical protein